MLCGVQHSLIMADSESQHNIIVIILIIYSSFGDSCRTSGKHIAPRRAISSSFYVKLQALNQLSSCWSVEIERAFYYAPHPLIDRAPRDDATSLTTYTTDARTSDTNIYIYIIIYIYIYKHTSNPWESNHRDGRTGHKNICWHRV